MQSQAAAHTLAPADPSQDNWECAGGRPSTMQGSRQRGDRMPDRRQPCTQSLCTQPTCTKPKIVHFSAVLCTLLTHQSRAAVQVISDLLKPERHNLTIKEDKKRGVFVDGLSEWVVRSPQEVIVNLPFSYCTPAKFRAQRHAMRTEQRRHSMSRTSSIAGISGARNSLGA